VEIDWIRASDNYLELHQGGRIHLLRTTLTALVDQLPPDQFAQISRSLLVNADRVIEIRTKTHGDYLVLLRDGAALSGSRNYRQSLERILDIHSS